MDCLIRYPGLCGLAVGRSHVDTPEGAGGALAEASVSEGDSTQRPSKKQKASSSRKLGSSEAPVVRICDSIDELIENVASQSNVFEVTVPVAQNENVSLRSDISAVNAKVNKLTSAVGEVRQRFQNSSQ